MARWLGRGIPALALAYLVVLGGSAVVAKGALDRAMPLAGDLQTSIAAGDTPSTKAIVDEIAEQSSIARISTGHLLWRGVEWLPYVGDDLQSVRLAAAAADDLVNGALVPFSDVDIAAIGPIDGAINLDAVRRLAQPLAKAASTTERVHIDLSGIDNDSLLPPVASAVGQMKGAVSDFWPVLNRLSELMPHVPTMLGADGPRNYIVMVQNNAEARTTGGNPGSLMMLTADAGRLEITQQAAATDMNTGRDAPIIPLSAGTEAVYGSRVGKWVQDTTMTPDFNETAALVRAFWSESYGDPGAGVLSLDPIALGYILEATGPVALADGARLTSENAAETLLNGVYLKYPGSTAQERLAQDAYFATAASGIFSKITDGSADLAKLVAALVKAGGEGRVLYSSTDPAETKAVAGTTLQGPLAPSKGLSGAVGVFVNDTTEGKLDYYADLSVRLSSDVCEAAEAPTYSIEATYNYNLQPSEVDGLPIYISTGRYYPRGVKATDLVFYGPVGSTFEAATLNGVDHVPVAGGTDQGRPAVRVRIENEPGTTHIVEVSFTGAANQQQEPPQVVHTPMMKDVPVELSTPGCQ